MASVRELYEALERVVNLEIRAAQEGDNQRREFYAQLACQIREDIRRTVKGDGLPKTIETGTAETV